MIHRHLIQFSVIGLSLIAAIILLATESSTTQSVASPPVKEPVAQTSPEVKHPMAIELLRSRTYPGSDLVIEETLSPGVNYKRFIASYRSDGLKLYGLLTVPTTPRPTNGYPTIIFLHGYVPPQSYSTTQDYVTTQDGLARSGFLTFKPDHRGHGKSEGEATGAHFSEAYVIDTLDAIASLKRFQDADPERIGIWGHSNGGEIGLRTMVVSTEIKAGVFWAGVVGSFEDMLETYNADIPFMRRTPELVTKYGLPSENPAFWNTLDPYTYLHDISGPVQLHHGTADNEVPVELSRKLKEALEKEQMTVELYEYEGANHNLSGEAFSNAMRRTIAFFNSHL